MKVRLTMRLCMVVVILCTMLQGCGVGKNIKEDENKKVPEKLTTIRNETTNSNAAQNSAKEASKPSYINDTGKVMIKSATTERTSCYNSSFVIISINGAVIVADPYSITPELAEINPDIITISHGHPEHIDFNYLNAKQCRKSAQKVERFNVKDVKVKGIAASHTSDAINNLSPTNVIYVFETDGIRIAHMGDLGQLRLTDGQIKELGEIDIMFTAFVELSTEEWDYGLSKASSISSIKQLRPKIVIPTHFSDKGIEQICREAGINIKQEMDAVIISKEDLKSGETKFIHLK